MIGEIRNQKKWVLHVCKYIEMYLYVYMSTYVCVCVFVCTSACPCEYV